MTSPHDEREPPDPVTVAVRAVDSIDAVPRILEVVCRVTGLGFAAVARVTEERWIACAVRDEIDFGLLPGGELPIETTICHEIRQHRRPVVIDDALTDPAFCGHPTLQRYGLRSYISVPITLPDGQFFGTLCAIGRAPARLGTVEVTGTFALFAELIAFHLAAQARVSDLSSRVADAAAMVTALNVELQRQVAASNADRETMRQLAVDVAHAREEERTRIARELHDELGQSLTAMKFDVHAAARASAARDERGLAGALTSMATLAESTLDALERIVSELRPAVLDTMGLAAAVEWFVGEFARRAAIEASCECIDAERIAAAPATVLFRVLQEALTNVGKHAGATAVRVVLRRDGETVALTVHDDGCGITAADLRKPAVFGIVGMRERLRAIGGRLDVHAVPSGGTSLVVRCAAQ